MKSSAVLHCDIAVGGGRRRGGPCVLRARVCAVRDEDCANEAGSEEAAEQQCPATSSTRASGSGSRLAFGPGGKRVDGHRNLHVM